MKKYRERMAAKQPHASQMPDDSLDAEDYLLLGIGGFAILVMLGLVVVAVWIRAGGAA